MPETKFISFREQATGRINDLLIDEHKACAPSQNLLGYLAGALLNYKDEGMEFAPNIVFCDSLLEFLSTFPGAVSHRIGTAPLDPASGPKILKDCAPLSGDNWFIFIERTDSAQLNYGVFTYFRLPTAIPLHEAITINPKQFCILLRKTSVNTIEMRGAKGHNLTFVFSTVREPANSSLLIEKFAAECCADLDENISKDFKPYFARLLDALLTSSHGTMLICGEKISRVPQLKDAVEVSPLLDFQTAFREFQTANTAESILGLQRCEELLQGLMNCDGMIAFDARGRITAYRIFFKPKGRASSDGASVVGGTRRRAFEGMKDLVGRKLVSVLFRSQDGQTLHHGVGQ